MTMKKRKSLVLAKIESTYGTDPTPAPATDSILVLNANVKPLGELLNREFDRTSLSNLPHVIGMREAEITFQTELKGSGSADNGTASDAPEIDPLLRACGFARTLTAGPAGNVTYDPVSASFESITLWVYKDGVIHKVSGCFGTFSVNMEAGKFGTVDWTFKGLYSDPIDGAIAAGAVYNAEKPPIFVNASFAIQTYAAIVQAFSFGINNEIIRRESANAADGVVGFDIGDRDVNGSMNPEAVTEATHDFWAKWKAGTEGALTLTLGSVVGAKLDITGPKLQYREINWGERNKIRTYEVPLNFAQNSGDDELKLKFY